MLFWKKLKLKAIYGYHEILIFQIFLTLVKFSKKSFQFINRKSDNTNSKKILRSIADQIKNQPPTNTFILTRKTLLRILNLILVS